MCLFVGRDPKVDNITSNLCFTVKIKRALKIKLNQELAYKRKKIENKWRTLLLVYR